MENKKLDLLRETFLQIYQIAKEYQSIAERAEQDKENLMHELDELKRENRELKEERDELVEQFEDIKQLLDDMREEDKNTARILREDLEESRTELDEKLITIDKYVKNIANDEQVKDDIKEILKNLESNDSIDTLGKKVMFKMETQDKELCEMKASIDQIIKKMPKNVTDDDNSLDNEEQDVNVSEGSSEGLLAEYETLNQDTEEETPNEGFENNDNGQRSDCGDTEDGEDFGGH